MLKLQLKDFLGAGALLWLACSTPSAPSPALGELQPACSIVPALLEQAPNSADCPPASEIESQLLPGCAGQNCHGSESPQLGVDLVMPQTVERLRDRPSRLPGCQDRLLIDTHAPECSFLLEKLSASPSCGDAMPLGSSGMDAQQLRCVYRWLLDSL